MSTGLIILSLVFVAVMLAYLFRENTYGSNLEQYITSNNPQNASDVDRLTFEYNTKKVWKL